MSADLDELGRTQVLVVCGGVKSILDVPKTLEALETRGVAVAALGTRDFPAFFSLRSPGVDGAPNRRRSASTPPPRPRPGSARTASRGSPRLRPRGAQPGAAPDGGRRGGHGDALAAARDAGVAGGTRALPPGGPRAAHRRQVARRRTWPSSSTTSPSRPTSRAGAAAARPPARRRQARRGGGRRLRDGPGRTRPARRRPASCARRGGVGANVARAAARRADGAPRDDGRRDAESLAEAGADARGCATAAAAPTYVALHGADGDLVGGVFAGAADAAAWDASAVAGARVVVVDANLSKDAYAAVLGATTRRPVRATSTATAAAAFAEIRHRCDVVTPNEAELAALPRARGGAPVGFRSGRRGAAQRAGAAVIATPPRGRGARDSRRAGRGAARARVAAGLANGAGDGFAAPAAARAAGRPRRRRAARARPPRAASSGARIQPPPSCFFTAFQVLRREGTALPAPGCLKSGYANSASSILMPRPWNSRARS